MRKFFSLVLIFFLAAAQIFCQQTQVSKIDSKNPLLIEAQDLFIERDKTDRTALHLYICKKSGIESVMLTETTKDPDGKENNYAYRASEWNSINGDEKRILNGEELKSEYAKYSLISSSPVNHKKLGEAFHIYIPHTLIYGYPWSRNGTVQIGKGTFVNIRTFSKKYCDYSGEFFDNPFMFDFSEKNEKPGKSENFSLTSSYNPEAAKKFSEIAKNGGGILRYSDGKNSLSKDLLDSFADVEGEKKIDVVFAIDTTGSMKDDLEILKTDWIPRFSEQLKNFKDFRIALLFYRDFNDNYNYKGMPVKYFAFTDKISEFKKCLETARIKGNEGGDVPEAVYEALYSALVFYNWREDAKKKIILLGDAEPHPAARGPRKITQETVVKIATEKNIILDCIIVPDKKKF